MPWTKAALWALLLCAVQGGPAGAHEIGVNTDQMQTLCGKHQLTGQYECVRSAP